jgi:hypothetical protein
MPQKSRSKKQTRKAPAPRPVDNQGADSSSQPLQVTSTGSSARSFATEFNPDYSQTIKDLRRIGILAGIFFGILIGLAFILP